MVSALKNIAYKKQKHTTATENFRTLGVNNESRALLLEVSPTCHLTLIQLVGWCCQNVAVPINFIAGEKQGAGELENSIGDVQRKSTSY